ncbi:MAG: NAD(P)-dependent oxidoreductase [Pseudomonadota bacterium]
MKTFPMFLTMTDRAVVIVGGGEQATQKARLTLKTEAELRLVAPDLDPELAGLVASGKARNVDAGDENLFENAALVFVATGCKGSDAAWHARAKAAGALVNVVDYPDLCDAMTPSIVDRDPVVVAIGTEGTAPLLGRQIKTCVEEMIHPRLGAFAALAGRLRTEVVYRINGRDRRDFWRWVFGDAPWRLFSAGREHEAAQVIHRAIQSGHRQSSGHLCIVLGATEPGLMPMAAVQRMQEADIIYMDRDLPETVLELARRDAERVLFAPRQATKQPFALLTKLSNTAGSRNVVYLTRQTDTFDLPGDGPAEQIVAARPAMPDHRVRLDMAAAG